MPGMIIAKSKKAVAVRITMLSRGSFDAGHVQVLHVLQTVKILHQ